MQKAKCFYLDKTQKRNIKKVYTIKLPCPVSANQRLIKSKTGILINSVKYRDWHYLALFQIRNQLPNIKTLTGPIKLSVEVHFKDHRRRDLDNIVKGLQDVLTEAKLFVDDCQIDELFVKRAEIDKDKKGYVIVFIDEIQGK